MRHILVTVALAACSGGKPAAAPVDEPLRLQPPDAVVLDSLISSNVIAIMKTKPEFFPALRNLQPTLGPSKNPCWSALEAKIIASYQLQVPRADGLGQTAYFILEGGLNRDEVERCVPAAITMFPVTAKRDGELLAISGPDGATAYAAWRPPFVVIGTRDLVNGALTSRGIPRWHELLSAAPDAAPIWWASADRLLENLFGVQTKHYEVALERIEAAPNPYFAGRATVTYHSPGDAAVVARRVKQGEVQLPLVDTPTEIVESIKRFKVKQRGPVVEIFFDLGMFAGLKVELLTELTARMMAAQQQQR